MARAFATASSQYLINGAAVVTAEPLTMACWFRSATGQGTNRMLMSEGTNGAVDRWTMYLDTTDLLGVQSVSGAAGEAKHSTPHGNNTWNHAAAVWTGSNSRTPYLDGVAGTADTTSISVTGVDRTLIGARINTTVGLYMNGDIAEAGIWNVALTAADIASLAKGFSPLLVRPQALVAYWPLIGRTDPEICPKGGFDMTLTNGPANADHCRIIMPY